MIKLEFDSKYWCLYDKKIPELLNRLSQNADTVTEEFKELMGYIWDAEVCLPPFYAVIPHMIYIAAKETFEISKALWSYIGSWVSIQDKFRSGIPEDILTCFDNSLEYAEKECAKTLSEQKNIPEEEASYLYPALFAFSGHAFGIMALSAYKDGTEGTSLVKCDNGHLNDVTVYDSGIVPYEQDEEHHIIPTVISDCFEYPLEKKNKNNWKCLVPKVQRAILSKDIPDNISSHLKLSLLMLENGVTPNLLMKFAFSLCGSLLYSEGAIDLASRMFHGWDMVKCEICGEEFQFSDHWCDD